MKMIHPVIATSRGHPHPSLNRTIKADAKKKAVTETGHQLNAAKARSGSTGG
ncbi:MAG: hypothetical protein HYW81_03360, partial [Parcubacteria group bacterium]|nr:hypothetical protein [Parcubacteria group bacterium]